MRECRLIARLMTFDRFAAPRRLRRRRVVGGEQQEGGRAQARVRGKLRVRVGHKLGVARVRLKRGIWGKLAGVSDESRGISGTLRHRVLLV